jgi:hypothetical protein
MLKNIAMLKKTSFILICCFTLFFNCKEDINTTFEDISITTETNNIVEVNIPKAIGNKEVSNNINSEITQKVISSLHIGEQENISATSIEESINDFNKEFKFFKSDFPESTQAWEAQIDSEVMFTSPEILCLALTSYINTGGAHGILNISFLNFEASTGHLIPNINLITNKNAFKQMALPYFKKAVADKDIFESELETFKLPENISYNEDGIVLLYNAYEIAPYATGILEFEIPYNEIENYLAFNSAR